MTALLAELPKEEFAEDLDNQSVEAGLNSAIGRASDALNGDDLILPVEFSFAWRDRPVSVAVDRDGEGGVVMSLCLKLGSIPFTAENGSVRVRTNYIMSRNRDLPLGRFAVGKGQAALFVAEVPLDGLLSSARIVTAVAKTLLRVAPYLDLAQPR